jgi:hypothetical protein
MVDLAHHDAPPLRLPLDSDCVARIEDVLTEQRRELDEWRLVSSSTDHGA